MNSTSIGVAVMKKYQILLLFLTVFTGILYCQDYKIMTYNLRYENDIDGENIWANRKDLIKSQIEYYEPDVIGTQEGVTNQIKWLDENLVNYDYVGIGREEGLGKDPGEFSAIFYNKNKLSVVKSGTFWLSATPKVVSLGWDAKQYRICSYVLLKDKKNGKQFFAFNTHFDHRGDIAREKSAELIWNQIKSINSKNYPVVLTGDFNLTPDSSPIKFLSEKFNDSRAVSKSTPFGPEQTFCNFDACKPPEKRIDYVFSSKGKVIVNKYATIANIWNVRYASDHYPILINIFITK
jgi:endonuclease/exonuclease/phosphatase family metal-dependent hydrolase